MDIERIDSTAGLYPLKEVWNRLLADSQTRTVEMTFEWQVTFWENFRQKSDLFILVVREAEAVIAIAPLQISRKRSAGVQIRTLEIIAASESNYQDLIIGKNNPAVLGCVLNYLLDHRGMWHQFSLRHIPENSSTIEFFLNKLHDKPMLQIVETDSCTFLALDTGWEEHKKSLGKERRHRMNNKIRRIEKDLGKIQLRYSLTEPDLQADLKIFFEFHGRRWQRSRTPSQFLDPRQCQFYCEAGSRLFTGKQLGMAVLEAGEMPLGHLLYFLYQGRILIQLIAYDPTYQAYSPLIVLQELFVADRLKAGVIEIDWGTDYPWKAMWANQKKQRLNLHLYQKRWLPFAVYAATRLYVAVRSRLRRNPRILNVFKIILSRSLLH
jgi:CelD/BcsL family acetyltransferase involved in cellulose biosynthesis